jgi:uncharacterized protein (TIGR01777 family)
MKILLTGATGFVGSALSRRLTTAGHVVLPVSRRPGARYDWSDDGLARGVREADAVVHLAGENLFGKRWSRKQKQILGASRVDLTRRLATLVAQRRPACFISASAIGYYGASEEARFDETTPRGAGFLADLCGEWESATCAAAAAGVRTAIVRLGVVLGQGGGALAKMLTPFKLGVGGPLGSGRQWVSWIHIDDLTSLIAFLLAEPDASGVFNATAPAPVTMTQLARGLGRALHRPALMPVPAPMLRLALGEVADVLLTGQYVEPRRAIAAGFRFQFTDVESALRDIVAT